MVSAKLIQKAGGSFDLGNAQVHYERWLSLLFFMIFLRFLLIIHLFIIAFIIKVISIRNSFLAISDAILHEYVWS